MTTVLGIDPGLDGALASLQAGRLVGVWDMPTVETRHGKTSRRDINEHGLVRIIVTTNPALVVLEDVHAMPKQGVTSMFRMGQNLGLIKGVCAGLAVRLEMVSPQRWKKTFGLGPVKDQSRQLASRTWPDMAHEFRLKKHDGRAEAALIAFYGVHHIPGI